jgi:hypothetical protein
MQSGRKGVVIGWVRVLRRLGRILGALVSKAVPQVSELSAAEVYFLTIGD